MGRRRCPCRTHTLRPQEPLFHHHSFHSPLVSTTGEEAACTLGNLVQCHPLQSAQPVAACAPRVWPCPVPVPQVTPHRLFALQAPVETAMVHWLRAIAACVLHSQRARANGEAPRGGSGTPAFSVDEDDDSDDVR
jgi:hypothetical protein